MRINSMLYIISILISSIVFISGLIVIHKKPHLANQILGKLVFFGCVLQILTNWLFWGEGTSFNPFAVIISTDKSYIRFMILCLVSIFCYSSALALLYKAHDFYNNPSNEDNL